MTENETLYTLALSRIPKLGSTNQRMLLEEAGSATRVYEYHKNIRELIPQATDKLVHALDDLEQGLQRAEEELNYICEKQIRCICLNDPDYPLRLKECPDAPIVLFYKGNADLNSRHILNIVGTRHCTEYGKDLCQRFITDLAEICPDALIVSGLAYGIDIQAHTKALEKGLKTIGVLAHGLDQIYPRMHRHTAEAMIQQGGLLTEFMSKTNADKVNFVRRNRIVAGIADATVVVESAEKGGALITAELAEGYSRDIFAFPGRITDPYSQGCNELIRKNRATLLQNAADFAELMGWQNHKKVKQTNTIQLQLFPELNPEEQLIIDCLIQTDCKPINQICIETNIPISRVSSILFSLEMKGIVKMLQGGNYRICSS